MTFQHRDSDVLPPLVGLYVLDERHLVPHHRDGGLFLDQTGDLLDPITQPDEAGLVPEKAELKAQHEQVESLGLLVLGVQLRRQPGHLLRELCQGLCRQ